MKLLAAAAAVVVVLAGCAGGDGGSPAATPVSASPEDPALAAYYDQELQWDDCGGGFECADLTVPLSYDEPDGQTIELEVIRLPAGTPGRRHGSLVVNPGGPGGSGVEYVRSAQFIVSKPVRQAYDVVGFDPRGVGGSAPIECLTDAQLDRFLDIDPDPDTPEEIAETKRLAGRFGPRCERESPDMVGTIGTPYVARDLDILRAALGDEQLSYLGKSYGTYIGALYADLFPTRVGRMVLDGGVDPELTTADLSRGQAIGFDVALTRYAQWCVEQRDCPIGDDPGAGVRRIADLLEQIEDRPLRAERGRPLTGGQANLGVIGSLYSGQDGWESLSYALEGAFEGDGLGLQSLSDWLTERRPGGGYPNNANEALYAVNCIDRPDRWDPEQTAGQAQEWSSEAPVFGAVIAWGNLPCYYWPAPAVDEPRRITAADAQPILVVGVEYDPATPYQWSVDLADQLESGVLVSWMGADGHTGYYLGSKCVDEAVDDYLLDGAVPQEDVECE